jgi:hypothetical protein
MWLRTACAHESKGNNLMKIRLAVAVLAVLFAGIWTLVLRPGFVPERYQQIAMLLAASVTASAAIWPARRLATIAQATNLVALGVYALIALSWARHDSEVAEGIAMMFVTGAILLVILPPVASIVALQMLKARFLK